MNQDISEQILSLAAAELRRMETENSFWQGAYSGMSLVDGDTTDRKNSIVYGTRNALTENSRKTITRAEPGTMDRLLETFDPKGWPKHHHGLLKE